MKKLYSTYVENRNISKAKACYQNALSIIIILSVISYQSIGFAAPIFNNHQGATPKLTMQQEYQYKKFLKALPRDVRKNHKKDLSQMNKQQRTRLILKHLEKKRGY